MVLIPTNRIPLHYPSLGVEGLSAGVNLSPGKGMVPLRVALVRMRIGYMVFIGCMHGYGYYLFVGSWTGAMMRKLMDILGNIAREGHLDSPDDDGAERELMGPWQSAM